MPRGGRRPNQTGRPRRKGPKTVPIWCGQMSEEAREFILNNLTPDERYDALMSAARQKIEDNDAST